MAENKTGFDKSRFWKYIFITVFSGLTIAYLGITLIPGPDKQVLSQYHLTTNSYRTILYPAIILLVASWIFTAIAAVRVMDYAHLIRRSKDGRAFHIIGLGIVVLSLTQPFNSLLANIFTHIERHLPHAAPTLTIINNYLSWLWGAIFFFLIALGATELLGIIKNRRRSQSPAIWTFAFIIISSIYSYFIVIQPIHTPLERRAYYLADWLLITTIAIPYVCIWYIGLQAAYKMYLYRLSTSGTLYKQAVSFLAAGFAVVVVSSILTRIITTVSSRLSQLSLTPLLFVVYGLIIIYALGFVLIAIGAEKLKKIEEA